VSVVDAGTGSAGRRSRLTFCSSDILASVAFALAAGVGDGAAAAAWATRASRSRRRPRILGVMAIARLRRGDGDATTPLRPKLPFVSLAARASASACLSECSMV